MLETKWIGEGPPADYTLKSGGGRGIPPPHVQDSTQVVGFSICTMEKFLSECDFSSFDAQTPDSDFKS
jgi:hypothetical protein